MNVTQPQNAIYASSYSGPVFGASSEIYISDNSNATINSYSNLGYDYQLPSFLLNLSNFTNSTTSTTSTSGSYVNNTLSSFLAGTYNFMTYEIETYSIDRNLDFF